MPYLLLDRRTNRRKIINGLASGLSLRQVCAEVGINPVTVYVFRQRDREFDRAVIKAAGRHGKTLRSLYVGVPPYKDRELQRRILHDISQGGCREDDLAKVAAKYGFGLRQWWRWRTLDETWRHSFDRALMRVRDPALNHGAVSAYRAGCRCPPCRTVTHPRERRYEALAEYQ
ncbi:hypothetical protein [Streptosporangium sp. NPDC000509]|uniref:hypothetical protein n=1 Tax=Streptosporangium sp. NPDC000509 TaxID=3366186 RepID=UPI0036C3543A